jgi:hypothetical protein
VNLNSCPFTVEVVVVGGWGSILVNRLTARLVKVLAKLVTGLSCSSLYISRQIAPVEYRGVYIVECEFRFIEVEADDNASDFPYRWTDWQLPLTMHYDRLE